MNRPALFTLIVVNMLLVFVLASEWFASNETTDSSQTKRKTVEMQNEELPSLNLETQNEEDYSDLVERPLFIKGRKPVEEPHEEIAPVTEVKKMEAFVWDLTGIFTSPKGLMAFFSRINGKVEKDNYRKLKLGDDIDGWRLNEIAFDKVMLVRAGDTKTLLLRKAKPKNSSPAVPVANVTQNTSQPSRSGIPQLAVPTQAQPIPALQQPETVQSVEPPADESDTSAQQ